MDIKTYGDDGKTLLSVQDILRQISDSARKSAAAMLAESHLDWELIRDNITRVLMIEAAIAVLDREHFTHYSWPDVQP